MNAVLRVAPIIRPMQLDDVDDVIQIESGIYEFPWTLGNFRDSLNAGYSCWAYEVDGLLIGYGVLMLAAGEAHLLNMSVAAQWQRQGHGRKLLEHFIQVANDYNADMIFLEVRPSNLPALALYSGEGFSEIAVRPDYYPAAIGRENAVVMSLNLQ